MHYLDFEFLLMVFGVKDISLGATFEGVGVGFDKVFESGDLGVEL